MADQAAHARSEATDARTGSMGARALLVALGGGIGTAFALVAALASGSGSGSASAPDLAAVPATEIADAAPTLTPGWAQQIIAQAKECVAPMAAITVATAGDTPAATIRIRSGNYVSPAFRISEVPIRIAIPYPAPYPTGHGVLTIEGDTATAIVSLSPGWRIEALKGSASHPVVWQPDKPC